MYREWLHRKETHTYLLAHCGHSERRKIVYSMLLSVHELLAQQRSDSFCYIDRRIRIIELECHGEHTFLSDLAEKNNFCAKCGEIFGK